MGSIYLKLKKNFMLFCFLCRLIVDYQTYLFSEQAICKCVSDLLGHNF